MLTGQPASPRVAAVLLLLASCFLPASKAAGLRSGSARSLLQQTYCSQNADTGAWTCGPTSITDVYGYVSSQPISVLSTKDCVNDASGQAVDNWDGYKEFYGHQADTAGYKGYLTVGVPAGAMYAASQPVTLTVNFRGPSLSTQEWAWYLFNLDTNTYDKVGSNNQVSWDSWVLVTQSSPSAASAYVNTADNTIKAMLLTDKEVGKACDRISLLTLRYQCGHVGFLCLRDQCLHVSGSRSCDLAGSAARWCQSPHCQGNPAFANYLGHLAMCCRAHHANSREQRRRTKSGPFRRFTHAVHACTCAVVHARGIQWLQPPHTHVYTPHISHPPHALTLPPSTVARSPSAGLQPTTAARRAV